MKYHLLAVFTLSCLIAQNATADPQTERIRQAAQENGTALTTGDYDRLLDFTFPLWRSVKSWIFVSVYRSKHRKFSLLSLCSCR
jgi:hypothetical protein